MRTVSYRLADLGQVVIHLGKMAENDATQVRIDAAEVFSEYPNAVPALDVINPTGEAYTVEVTLDGSVVVWNVKDSSLTAEGQGEIQLTFTQNGTKVKSSICRTQICRSISGGGTPPDPVQDWLDHANEVLEEVEDAFPEGGTTGQVLAKKSDADFDTEWVDQGSGGTTDYTELTNKPQIGGVTLTGNKTLHDLGAAAESDIPDVSGFYTKPAGGIPASDIAEGVIQDPTSIIDGNSTAANKVWPASKSADLLSAITQEQIEELLLRDELPGTSKTVTFDSDDNPASITHTANGSTVRTDVFTWGEDSVTEVRTASDKRITITTDLTTLAQTISEIEEVA